MVIFGISLHCLDVGFSIHWIAQVRVMSWNGVEVFGTVISQSQESNHWAYKIINSRTFSTDFGIVSVKLMRGH